MIHNLILLIPNESLKKKDGTEIEINCDYDRRREKTNIKNT